ncbi:MAG: hypothetical protein IJW92_09595 [Clostridia bacterium]|nr:hypothetical protein [Clostridia bacterium]
MKNQFRTISMSKKNIKVVLLTWAVMSAVALLGLLISVAACIFFEAIILFVCLFMLFLVSKTKWILDFEDASLTITNMANHQQYYFEDLKYNDFLFLQNELQKGKNCGHLKIVGSSAVFNDVQQFEEMKSYIRDHFE